MTKLIRNKATGKFLKPNGAWSKNVSWAMHFADVAHAMEIQQRFDLSNVELVLLLGDKPSGHDVTVYLQSG